MQVSWQDEIRSWDPDQYGGVRFVYPGMTGMWRPRVIVTNSIEERDVFGDNRAPFNLAWDGTARWFPGAVLRLSCTMDMTYFPFDRQRCMVRFLTQEYGSEVNLIPSSNTVNTNNYGEHGEWELESTSVYSDIVDFGVITFSRVTYYFDFRRRPGFYLMNVLVPVILMSLLSPLVFILPEESGERVSFSVTLLLSLAVFMGIVAGHLPQSSQPLPLTILYLFALLIHCGLCVVFSVLHLKWEQYRAKQKQKQRKFETVHTSQYQQYVNGQDQNKPNGHAVIEDVASVDESTDKACSRNQLLENNKATKQFFVADFNQTSELYSRLFTGVDTRISPSVNASIPKDVYLVLNILSLREIQQAQQYFVINIFMQVSWQDEIRSWDPDQYGGVRFVYPGMTGMWRPRVIVTNSIEERDVFGDNRAPFNLAWDGTARWFPGAVLRLSCTMDMTYFPFDRQRCMVRFLTQEYGSEVNLIPSSNTVNTNNYGEHGEWELESTSVYSDIVDFRVITFSGVTYYFDFRRRPGFYLMNVLVPVILMSLLSPLVFILPEESGERVSFSVTLLLSLAVFMGIVAGHLPQSSQPLPLTILYLFALLIHCGLCVVFSVLHLKWEQYRAKQKQKQRKFETVHTSQYQQYVNGQDQNKPNGHAVIEDVASVDESTDKACSRNQHPRLVGSAKQFYVLRWFVIILHHDVMIVHRMVKLFKSNDNSK
ncbi:hypothetical protein EGW08_017443 [Elysia chlorotica]|uniref:Neurotransmitter-gated ion-channel ligand-binding domain-containing protein n=1 Tax=Elysia chlorotica TaxID=188477 RepID=A0A3S0ZTC5_ELYCH|nr:hypothetical protein EGW08_017443 [Elysia chlorotica]